MAPLYKTNFFLFVPEKSYSQRQQGEITYKKLIKSSKFLHEVASKEVYFMLFANDRIPWLYDLKDKVCFKTQKKGDPLEYEVIGRYSMSSNLMNEHLESDTIQDVLHELLQE